MLVIDNMYVFIHQINVFILVCMNFINKAGRVCLCYIIMISCQGVPEILRNMNYKLFSLNMQKEYVLDSRQLLLLVSSVLYLRCVNFFIWRCSAVFVILIVKNVSVKKYLCCLFSSTYNNVLYVVGLLVLMSVWIGENERKC